MELTAPDGHVVSKIDYQTTTASVTVDLAMVLTKIEVVLLNIQVKIQLIRRSVDGP